MTLPVFRAFFTAFYASLFSYIINTFLFSQFISTSVCGVFSSLICDFGSNFEVTDVDGLEPTEFLIGHITNVSNLTSKVPWKCVQIV